MHGDKKVVVTASLSGRGEGPVIQGVLPATLLVVVDILKKEGYAIQ